MLNKPQTPVNKMIINFDKGGRICQSPEACVKSVEMEQFNRREGFYRRFAHIDQNFNRLEKALDVFKDSCKSFCTKINEKLAEDDGGDNELALKVNSSDELDEFAKAALGMKIKYPNFYRFLNELYNSDNKFDEGDILSDTKREKFEADIINVSKRKTILLSEIENLFSNYFKEKAHKIGN